MSSKTDRDDLELKYLEQNLELSYQTQLWELKERKIKLFFSIGISIALLIFWGYAFLTVTVWSTSLGVIATVLAFALRSALSRILTNPPEANEQRSLISVIRRYLEQKTTKRLILHTNGERLTERQLGSKADVSAH